jgi:hypothetical protein
MVYRTISAEPEMFQLVGRLYAGLTISLRDFEYVYYAFAQVDQWLHASRICAVVNHFSPIILRRATWTLESHRPAKIYQKWAAINVSSKITGSYDRHPCVVWA